MTMSRPLVIYHAQCPDGWCAAWIANLYFGEGKADFFPASYGTDSPDVTNRDVFILDFSYPRNVMNDILGKAQSVVLCDHHKSAVENLEGLEHPKLTLLFDMEKSGARLTWEHFYPKNRSSWLVDYTEDRDLWRWELPHSCAINGALSTFDKTFKVWDQLNVVGYPQLLIPIGEAVLRQQKMQVEQMTARAVEREICGHRVLIANATTHFSEVAGKLAEGRPFGVCYFIREDGKVQVSLRSTKSEQGVDVSKIAKHFGGGGHPSAAGLELTMDDFVKLISTTKES